MEKQAARCKRRRGYSFVLNMEKEAALTGNANTEWKYKYTEMRGGEKKKRKRDDEIGELQDRMIPSYYILLI